MTAAAPAPQPRNAAIWFAPDGYDPAAKGINGRRVAGESFLKGFLAHAEVEEFVCLTYGQGDAQAFADFAARRGVQRRMRGVRLDALQGLGGVRTISYPSPNFASECWRRAPYGAAAFSICGITHTTATKAVMQGMVDLRMAPQMPWDAVICTSRAVRDSVGVQMELTDAFIRHRFPGAPVPARPLLPVIPLGVTCDDFAPDPGAGAALRARLGIAPQDAAFAIIARLTPHEKFDPLPLYIALQQAQGRVGPGQRLHLILCGLFRDDYGRRIFDAGAAALMPGVGYHVLDGANAAERKATLSAAQAFLFPIDNLQETFGLAPIEAMAAGLPVIVSDWDGIKDTVTPEAGFRIPTEMARPDAVTYLGQRHLGGTDSYVQYLSQMSALTRLDVAAMVEALVALATNADLRARMGAAAAARARAEFDWARIVPRMQDLWAEQEARRAAADPAAHRPFLAGMLPVHPSPSLLFRSYPTKHFGGEEGRRFTLAPLGARPGIEATLALRDYEGTKRIFEPREKVLAVAGALALAGEEGATAPDLARATAQPLAGVERVLLWLLKYDFARG